MAAVKNGTRTKWLDTMLNEASRRILHAMALAAGEAEAEWVRAAECEERVACLLEAGGDDLEAAIHRFSAASCFAKAQKFADAVTLARSALSYALKEDYRLEIERYLKKWLAKAKTQLQRQARKQTAPAA